MKKRFYLILTVLTAITATTWYACETDPEETCLQDEFCEIPVTTCCDDNDVCVYKYNGKEYPDTEAGVEQLLEDMNCVASIVKTEAPEQKNARAEILMRLQNLMDRTKAMN